MNTVALQTPNTTETLWGKPKLPEGVEINPAMDRPAPGIGVFRTTAGKPWVVYVGVSRLDIGQQYCRYLQENKLATYAVARWGTRLQSNVEVKIWGLSEEYLDELIYRANVEAEAQESCY